MANGYNKQAANMGLSALSEIGWMTFIAKYSMKLC